MVLKKGPENIISNNTTLTNTTPGSSNHVSTKLKNKAEGSNIEIHSNNLLEELTNEIASSEAFCIDFEIMIVKSEKFLFQLVCKIFSSNNKNREGRPSIEDLIKKLIRLC